jgi:hypothetical protein
MNHTDNVADTLIPVALLAVEHGEPIEQLAAHLSRLGATITVTKGLRYVSAEVAQHLHEQREAARQADAERRRQFAQPDPVHERVRAIRRRQAELRAAGLDLDGVAMLQAVSGDLDTEQAADRAGEELMARSLAEALDPPRPPAKPESPFELLWHQR